MKKLLLAAMLALTACDESKTPESNTQSTNPGYVVSKLFTHEDTGCTVYRFVDTYYRYFVVCPNGQAKTETKHNCGKNCNLPDSISTERL